MIFGLLGPPYHLGEFSTKTNAAQKRRAESIGEHHGRQKSFTWNRLKRSAVIAFGGFNKFDGFPDLLDFLSGFIGNADIEFLF